jgi:hypothetical protein
MTLKDDIKLFQENKNFEPKNRRRVTTNTIAFIGRCVRKKGEGDAGDICDIPISYSLFRKRSSV